MRAATVAISGDLAQSRAISRPRRAILGDLAAAPRHLGAATVAVARAAAATVGKNMNTTLMHTLVHIWPTFGQRECVSVGDLGCSIRRTTETELSPSSAAGHVDRGLPTRHDTPDLVTVMYLANAMQNAIY